MQSNFSEQPHNQNHKHKSQPLKMGVIGVGNMGRHHARILSLLKDIELVGICDSNLARGIEIASQYRTHFYENYEELLPQNHVSEVAMVLRKEKLRSLRESLLERCLYDDLLLR